MIIYTGALLWMLLIYLYKYDGIIAFDEMQEASKLEAFLVMFPLVFFIGLRSRGADTTTYISSYNLLPVGFKVAIHTLLDFSKRETLFEAYGIFMKTIFGSNYTPYLFGIAAGSGYAITKVLRRYSDAFFTSTILFMLWGTWAWMFNGIRQFWAVSITFLGLRFIDEDKPVQYLIIVLIASRIHATALLMIPIYFIVRGNPWELKTLVTIIFAISIILSSNHFLGILVTAMEGMDYGNILTSEYFINDNGSHPIRTVLYSIPTVLAFMERETIKNCGSGIIKICVNMSIICVCFSAIANVTSGLYFGRLPIYFSIYNMILLPWIFCHTDVREQKGWIPAIMILYTAFYIYEHYFYGFYRYTSEILHLILE